MTAAIFPFQPRNTNAAAGGADAMPAQRPSDVLRIPTHPNSLTKRDVTALCALTAKLAGRCVCTAWRDDDGDLEATVERDNGRVFGDVWIVYRHHGRLGLIDAAGRAAAFDSMEALSAAIGDTLGLASAGPSLTPPMRAQRPSVAARRAQCLLGLTCRAALGLPSRYLRSSLP
jgi:hypothetical protein